MCCSVIKHVWNAVCLAYPGEFVKILKWWFHVARITDDKWTKKVLERYPRDC